MGKGKKKKGGQAQEPGSSESSTPATHAEDVDPGDTEATESGPSSRKDKRAAKKAAMKQPKQGGGDAGEPSQIPITEQVPIAGAASSKETVYPAPVHDVPTAAPSMFTGPPGTATGRGRGQGRGRGRGRGRGMDSGYDQGAGDMVSQGGRDDRRQFPQQYSAQQQQQQQQPPPFAGRGRGRQTGPPQQFYSHDQNFPPVGGARPKQSPWQKPQQPPMHPPPGMPAQPPPGMPAQQPPPGMPAQQPPPGRPAQQPPPGIPAQQPPPGMPAKPPPGMPAKPPPGMPAKPPPGMPAQTPQSQQQPQPRGTPPRQQTPQHKQQSPRVIQTLADRVQSLSLDTLNIPVRKNLNVGGTEGRRTIVATNHLKLNFSGLKNKTCVHYDVDIQPERPKRLYRAAVQIFISRHFPNRYPAFDGRKNLVASSFLPGLTEGQELSDTVSVPDDERDSQKEFTVTIKCVNIVDLTCLGRYMEEGANLDLPQMAIQMLDIVIRSAPAKRFIQVGRSFFTPPQEIKELGNGMHMWLGFYQSVILGWKPFLNVDVAHKGFPAPKNVKDIVSDVLNTYNCTVDLSRPLSQYQTNDLSLFLKGLKVEYKLPGQERTKRTYRVNAAESTAERLTFKLENGSTISVADYFKKEKRFELRYPHLPCLYVGSLQRENRIYLPLELCTILPGQVTFRKMNELQTSAMIKFAATSTDERKRKIQTAITNAQFNNDPGIKEFGIVINDKFENVEARVLKAPALTYKTGDVEPVRGVWRTSNFLNGKGLSRWWMVNYGTGVRPDDLWKFSAELVRTGRGLGMDIQQQQDIINMDRRDNVNKLYKVLGELKSANAELVIVVIDDNRKGVYAEVKQMAELQVGLVTQCLKRRTVIRGDRATVSNVLLKINSKLNGVNHKLAAPVRPPCLARPAMIIGADVTHPSPDQKTIPSVAAVCASHDPDAFQYNFEYRLQPPRQEIIKDLKEIMCSQLRFFYAKTRMKPERLIFYRDGVSEGQFAMVLNEELSQIRAACKTLNENYQPQITFLVVQKRHHTRFFPLKAEDEDGRNKNVPPGTIVDTTITHPRHIDFYLVSHASIQGVSRPTKYRTLWDDSNMSVDELEKLTYYLCHLFSRCTRSVSYPAPTYYAHLAAYRARAYIEGKSINLDRLSEEQAQRVIKEEICKFNPMFFV